MLNCHLRLKWPTRNLNIHIRYVSVLFYVKFEAVNNKCNLQIKFELFVKKNIDFNRSIISRHNNNKTPKTSILFILFLT